MKHLIKHFALWDIVLIIGVAAIAIPIAAHVSPDATAAVGPRHESPAQPTIHVDAVARHSRITTASVSRGVARHQDDYYDRRRRYWEDRVERDLDEEENGGDEDAKDSKDSKAKDDEDKAGSEDKENSEEEMIERRREYWRDRLDREW